MELIGVAGDSRKLMDAAPGALVAFAPGGHDAAVVHAGTLTVFQDVIGAATRRDVTGLSLALGGGLLVRRPHGFRGQRARPHGERDRCRYRRSVSLACDCAPTSLVPMGALFRLNEMSAPSLAAGCERRPQAGLRPCQVG